MKLIVFAMSISLMCIASTYSATTPADKLLSSRMRTPLLKTEGTLTGEGQCWHAAYNMSAFLDSYRETRDTAYLDAAVRYFDALLAKLHTAPDGYKGWVGPYIYDKKYICDVHVGDAILFKPMLAFSETVLKHDDRAIVKTYQAKAHHYVDMAKKHLIEKWDRRGTWHEDGPFGAYVSWDHYMTKDNLATWRERPAGKSNLSLPFNKQNDMGICCLRLYRVTGEKFYREKALKIFNYMKSRMCLFRDHYVWNYWEPFGPWDIDSVKHNSLRHWVNVHPYRNYQAGEVHDIAEAYHSGLTFTKKDIQRIINTNLKVMWNGDEENPKWRNANHAVQKAALGEIPIKKAPGGHFPKLAGTLWTALDDFSNTIRDLAGRQADGTPSFERKYPDLPVTEFKRPFHGNQWFSMAAMMPSEIKKGETAHLVSQTRAAGKVTISLYSRDGLSKIKDIRLPKKSDRKGLLIIPWQPKNVPAGKYRIRWMVKGEYREFPIGIQ